MYNLHLGILSPICAPWGGPPGHPCVAISVADLRSSGHRRLVRRDAAPHTRSTRRKWSVIVWQCRSDRHRFPTLGHSRHLVNITVACSLAHMLHRRLRNGRTFEENFCRTCFEFVGVWRNIFGILGWLDFLCFNFVLKFS